MCGSDDLINLHECMDIIFMDTTSLIYSTLCSFQQYTYVGFGKKALSKFYILSDLNAHDSEEDSSVRKCHRSFLLGIVPTL